MAGMDYNLAALKLLSCELRSVKQKPSTNNLSLFGIHFQRAWLQGILISGSEDGQFLLDDGTGIDVVELTIPTALSPSLWKRGMHVMVVGRYLPPTISPDALPSLLVHKMVDLSSQPDREALWYLEVVEAHKLFYLKT